MIRSTIGKLAVGVALSAIVAGSAVAAEMPNAVDSIQFSSDLRDGLSVEDVKNDIAEVVKAAKGKSLVKTFLNACFFLRR